MPGRVVSQRHWLFFVKGPISVDGSDSCYGVDELFRWSSRVTPNMVGGEDGCSACRRWAVSPTPQFVATWRWSSSAFDLAFEIFQSPTSILNTFSVGDAFPITLFGVLLSNISLYTTILAYLGLVVGPLATRHLTLASFDVVGIMVGRVAGIFAYSVHIFSFFGPSMAIVAANEGETKRVRCVRIDSFGEVNRKTEEYETYDLLHNHDGKLYPVLQLVGILLLVARLRPSMRFTETKFRNNSRNDKRNSTRTLMYRYDINSGYYPDQIASNLMISGETTKADKQGSDAVQPLSAPLP